MAGTPTINFTVPGGNQTMRGDADASRGRRSTMSDFDGCWKETLDLFFSAFLAFFFPDIHADIDWTVDYESLEQELRQLAPSGEAGKRLADKLVKVSKRGSGDPAYLHVEVQNQRDDDLDERNRRYNDRAQDRYN